jgi:hypothetical protein
MVWNVVSLEEGLNTMFWNECSNPKAYHEELRYCSWYSDWAVCWLTKESGFHSNRRMKAYWATCPMCAGDWGHFLVGLWCFITEWLVSVFSDSMVASFCHLYGLMDIPNLEDENTMVSWNYQAPASQLRRRDLNCTIIKAKNLACMYDCFPWGIVQTIQLPFCSKLKNAWRYTSSPYAFLKEWCLIKPRERCEVYQ